jgi:YidC/Oxa1 family membrane protein insertase
MANLWNLILTQPLLNSLIAFYKLTGNLGWAIILLTIALRLLMTPLVLPSLKISKKVQELAPELAKLKEMYKDDKQKLVTAQAELYKKHGANPASGCLPQIIQLLVLIALFSVFNSILKADGSLVAKINPNLYSFNQLASDFKLNPSFLYMDLTKPDVFHLPSLPFPLPGLFLLLSALTQLISTKMMAPEIAAEKKVAEKTKGDTDDTMVEMQQQMAYMFPLMTLIIGFQFPAGLVIYWSIFSLVSAFQQYSVSGWGGLKPWLIKLNLLKSHSYGSH